MWREVWCQLNFFSVGGPAAALLSSVPRLLVGAAVSIAVCAGLDVVWRLLAPMGVIHLGRAIGVVALGGGCRGGGCQSVMVMVEVVAPSASCSV